MVPVVGHMLVDGLVFARLVTLSSITEMQGNHSCVSGIWGQGHQERDEPCMQGDEGEKGQGEATHKESSLSDVLATDAG